MQNLKEVTEIVSNGQSSAPFKDSQEIMAQYEKLQKNSQQGDFSGDIITVIKSYYDLIHDVELDYMKIFDEFVLKSSEGSEKLILLEKIIDGTKTDFIEILPSKKTIIENLKNGPKSNWRYRKFVFENLDSLKLYGFEEEKDERNFYIKRVLMKEIK
ncbi:hypothetical protein NUSPORA_02792 [Nucleospora cyclopteri]